jgi:hypothetical protein
MLLHLYVLAFVLPFLCKGTSLRTLFFNFIHLPATTLLDCVISQTNIHYLRQEGMKHTLYIYFTKEITLQGAQKDF